MTSVWLCPCFRNDGRLSLQFVLLLVSHSHRARTGKMRKKIIEMFIIYREYAHLCTKLLHHLTRYVAFIILKHRFFQNRMHTSSMSCQSVCHQHPCITCVYRLRMRCSLTRWRSNQRRVVPSLRPPTIRPLCSPSLVLKMEEGRSGDTSTLHTAPRTSPWSPSHPVGSWLLVSFTPPSQDVSSMCHVICLPG